MIPRVIHRFVAQQEIPTGKLEELRFEWAYRKVNPKLFLSFHQPPDVIVNEHELKAADGAEWPYVDRIEGIWSPNLVSELLRKALIVKCHEKGLEYCSRTHLHYFPSGTIEGDRLKYTQPDGSKNWVNASGQRKFWQPSGSSDYRYYLAPDFSIAQNLFDDFVVLVRIRIRFSDTAGKVLAKRTAVSRRKHLCKDWWNNDWLNRVCAVCQHLAEDGRITIGTQPKEQITINAVPLSWNAPLGINETALNRLSYERSAILTASDDDEPDESENDNDSVNHHL